MSPYGLPHLVEKRRRGLVFLAAAALCLILAMSSCQKSGGGAEAPVVTGFECDVALTYRDMEITGHLTG